MISDQAREGFDNLFVQAIRSGLVASPDDVCEIEILPNQSDIKETKVVVITISSYLFRLIALIYFSPDNVTKEHCATINNTQPSDMNDRGFYDAIAERGVICCGTLNRNLSRFFPHIGMSTPNFLEKGCSAHLDELECGHIRHFKMQINQNVLFHASLCICDYADIDFEVDLAEEEESTGELEMF